MRDFPLLAVESYEATGKYGQRFYVQTIIFTKYEKQFRFSLPLFSSKLAVKNNPQKNNITISNLIKIPLAKDATLSHMTRP